MTRINLLNHEFVNYIPNSLDKGVVYVSIPFATVVHLCCCGCGNEVVTPLDPTDWQMTFDGKSVSLSPSIGNWSLGCQSHYWIYRNQVRWARHLSMFEIKTGRTLGRIRKAWRFGRVWQFLWRQLPRRFRRVTKSWKNGCFS